MENRIIIRQARKEEAARIAQLFLLAWPVEEMAQASGISPEMLLESVTGFAEREDTIYSYTKTFVAEAVGLGSGVGAGLVVGAMCGYDGADYQALKQPIVDVLGEGSDFAQLRETEAGEYYLDSVGVLPQWRGNGIAARLFKAHFERAASQGHKVAGLIVDVGKPQAEALYARLGFKHVGFKDFFGHEMKHMVRELSSGSGCVENEGQRALVLEGGGLRGVFTCGVLDCFMDHGVRFPFIVGVSAGACNGLSYMSGQRGRAKATNIDLMDKYKYVGLKYLFTQRCIMDYKLLFEDFPAKVIPYDYEAYFANPARFVMVTTNCLTGQAEYMEDKTSSERVMSIVRASSSLPFVSTITYVDGVPMLDGGIADSIPLEYAFSQGYDRAVVVLTRNRGYRKKESSMKAAKVFYRKYPHLQAALAKRNKIYNKTMDLIETLEEQGRIIDIRPERPVEVGRMEKDTAKLTALYEEGYRVAQRLVSENQI